LRPGAGPGPDQNWLNYQCDRFSRVCRITGGDLGFTASYAALFAGHNAGLQSGSNLPGAESRYEEPGNYNQTHQKGTGSD
jgi:hypothetical protein